LKALGENIHDEAVENMILGWIRHIHRDDKCHLLLVAGKMDPMIACEILL
jgi:hypothetical protein